MQNLTQLPVENLDVVNDSTVPSSGDPKPSKSLGPAPKVSTKVISFAISPRHKTSESQFGISSSPSDPQYAYKIKTTAPKKFCVRPNQGMVRAPAPDIFTIRFLNLIVEYDASLMY